MLGAKRQTHRERVAVAVFEQTIAPAVRWPVLRRREHSVTAGARATLRLVRIDPEEADLDAEAALPGPAQTRSPRLSCVGAVGMQLDRRAIALERRVVRGLVQGAKAEDVRIEGS